MNQKPFSNNDSCLEESWWAKQLSKLLVYLRPMRLVNETLSNLKAYARREYTLNRNVPILVMLITEEESRLMREHYDRNGKANTEKGAITLDTSKEPQATHYSVDFFPNVACIVELIHQ